VIWLTWRQFRAQAVGAVAVLGAFAVLLAVTGPQLAGRYAASGISGCTDGDCSGLATRFLDQVQADATDWTLYLLGIVVVLLAPAVIGIFWGAPLIAREIEAGTCHLAWNQTITRTRWLAVKLTLTGLVAMAVAEALSLMQALWAAPISAAIQRGASLPIANGQFDPLVFASHGVAPLGYAAFAFALGVTAGLVTRRVVLAMAVTLAIFAAVQVATPLWVRPHLFPADRTITALSSVSDISYQSTPQGAFTFSARVLSSQPGAWVLSSRAVDAAGSPVSTAPAACMQAVLGESGLDCLGSHGVRVAVTYQPASRYWTFQWTETAIYLALALALAGYCFWRLGRRLT